MNNDSGKVLSLIARSHKVLLSSGRLGTIAPDEDNAVSTSIEESLLQEDSGRKRVDKDHGLMMNLPAVFSNGISFARSLAKGETAEQRPSFKHEYEAETGMITVRITGDT